MQERRVTLRIILHAGTPKTGTTSLQLFLDANYAALLDRGVLYPRAGITPPPEPKHQWMIGALMNKDPRHFTTMLERALGEARQDTHTMVLSSEGLFHRWWDFSPTGLNILNTLATRFPLSFWVFFREPVSFVRSFYIQMLKNPRGLGPCYGQDVSVEEILDDPRFRLHLDYIRYIRNVETVVGEGKVRPFRYTRNTIVDALAALDITDMDPGTLNENRTVGELGASFLRLINQRELSVEQKRRAVQLVEQLEELVDGDTRPLRLEPEVVGKIRELSASSLLAIEDIYGLPIGAALNGDVAVKSI
jgi:hypothetical protein